jgi:uncharacterized membrane protein YgdD (TMEM256/DUF423 family)
MKKIFHWSHWPHYFNMHRNFLIIASVLGAISVALGAFAAHKLREMLSPEMVGVFETGVRYQFYHVFALFIVAITMQKYTNKWMFWAGNCFITGIVLFSGSLYALAVLRITESGGSKYIGVITPFGGLFLIAGWLFLLLGFSKT